MIGRFEIYEDVRGKYRFRLRAGNGQIIAVGEAYESMASCLNGVESVRNNAPAACLVDLTGRAAARAGPRQAARRRIEVVIS